MTPNEVIEKLSNMGISISRKTLYNYEKWGLISEPVFRNSRNTDYPNIVIEEVYAAWKLLHGQYGDENTKQFFSDKLPILSPIAVSAVKNITHGQDVEESLRFLISKQNRDEKKYFWGHGPEIKMPQKLEEELDAIRHKAVRDVIRRCKEESKSLEEDQLFKEEMQLQIEKKIQQLTSNDQKRHNVVLMIEGTVYSAINYEKAELERHNRIYGASNMLKKAYYDIYVTEIQKAKDILKTLN
jgi:hypothetical protein